MNQNWQSTLVNSQVDGAALGNSTVATSLLPGAAKITLPNNFFDTIGKILAIKALGRISNIVTTPGTLTLDVRFGSVIVFNGGAISLNTVAKTNVSFELEITLTCRAIGSGTTANLMGQGMFTAESVVSAPAGTAQSASLPATAPAVGTGFDSTATQLIDLFGTWSIANAGNTLQVHQYQVYSLN